MPVGPAGSGFLVSAARWLTVLVVGAIAATLSALPAAYLGYVTASSWTGCFGQCGEPDRGLGMKAAFIALVVVSGPVALMAVLMPRGQRLRWVPVFAVLVLAVMSLVTLVWVRIGVSLLLGRRNGMPWQALARR